MQTSAVPDLAHNHARPVHWLATATAMAAVVAAAGLLQPDRAGAGQTGGRETTAATVPAPGATGVPLPLECGGAPTVVVEQATGDLDGDGGPEAVVAARCEAGSGTPPSGIYVLARSRTGEARVVATLLEPARRQSAGGLAVRDGAVTAVLLGYSSPDVPRCCPDRRQTVKWRWSGGKFTESAEDAEDAEDADGTFGG
ncbi:hypothetical protein AB0I99_06785 [Streptomyces spongiicola]|uniref:Secreted protein n=1 Tax=Streptomyces spongiicola TaxID=1690221 RepID=A0ABM6V1F5_9ACTN|nr:hypothetical protein [Streptomyces spongiicola]AWK07850.1 hypothetical protein DDQ41_01740 [Streptomyces spongiicola]